jgi:hypothetical protein
LAMCVAWPHMAVAYGQHVPVWLMANTPVHVGKQQSWGCSSPCSLPMPGQASALLCQGSPRLSSPGQPGLAGSLRAATPSNSGLARATPPVSAGRSRPGRLEDASLAGWMPRTFAPAAIVSSCPARASRYCATRGFRVTDYGQGVSMPSTHLGK